MNQNQQQFGSQQSNNPGIFDSLRRLKEKLDTEAVQKKDPVLEKPMVSIQVKSMGQSGDEEEKNAVNVKMKGRQIKQLLFWFQKNGVIKSEATLHFVEQMLGELPLNLVDDVYNMYSDAEIAKLKLKK